MMKKQATTDVGSLFKSSISRMHKVLAASVILAAGLLYGCSDSDVTEGEVGGDPDPAQPGIETQAITVNNNPASHANRITLYGDEGGARSRAEEGVITKYKLERVAMIQSPDSKRKQLSATCVYPYDKMAYVCYHLNEAYEDNVELGATNEHQGAVELVKYEETPIKSEMILSQLVNSEQDFNHCVVDDGMMYTVGDAKAGAILGKILLKGDKIAVLEDMPIFKLGKGSGNCIVIDKGDFHIATTAGFMSANIDKLTSAWSVENLTPLNGKEEQHAKHIAKGDGYYATLHLIKDAEKDNAIVEKDNAIVNVYDEQGKVYASFNAGTIAPINGKNTIAINDKCIYVCLGENGVAKYDLDGHPKGSYNWLVAHPTSKLNKPCANGVAVDDKYVYIAYGGVGVVVLNKETMERVTRYYIPEEKDENGNVKSKGYSANYVALVGDGDDKQIYVAYGRNGLAILKWANEYK